MATAGAVTISRPWVAGINPASFMTNGRMCTANASVMLADYVNMLAGRRLKVLVAQSLPAGQVVGETGSRLTWYFRFHTSPGVEQIRVAMIIAPADTAIDDAAEEPLVLWLYQTMNPLGTLRNGATISTNKRKPTAANTFPNDYLIREDIWTTDITGDTDYQCILQLDDFARLLSFVVYEQQNELMNVDGAAPFTADNAVMTNLYTVGGEVTDLGIGDLWNTAYKIHKRQGARILTWSAFNTNLLTTTSATFVNVFDSAFTAWDANAPGAWCWPYKKGTYNSNNVPVKLLAHGNVTGGGTGTIEWRVNGTTIGSTTFTNLLADWLTEVTGNLNAANANDKIDIFVKTTAGTVSIRSLSIYEYDASTDVLT
mgnify:CR=1 FL=1